MLVKNPGSSRCYRVKAKAKRARIAMPYGLIVQVASVAFAAAFVLAAEASYWLKALVAGLLFFSFRWRYGLFLQVALGVSLSLYFTYLKCRSERS